MLSPQDLYGKQSLHLHTEQNPHWFHQGQSMVAPWAMLKVRIKMACHVARASFASKW